MEDEVGGVCGRQEKDGRDRGVQGGRAWAVNVGAGDERIVS